MFRSAVPLKNLRIVALSTFAMGALTSCDDGEETRPESCTSALVTSIRIGTDDLVETPAKVTTSPRGAFRVRVTASAFGGGGAPHARLRLQPRSLDAQERDAGSPKPPPGAIDDVLVSFERQHDGSNVGDAVLVWPEDGRVRLTVAMLDCVKSHVFEVELP